MGKAPTAQKDHRQPNIKRTIPPSSKAGMNDAPERSKPIHAEREKCRKLLPGSTIALL